MTVIVVTSVARYVANDPRCSQEIEEDKCDRRAPLCDDDTASVEIAVSQETEASGEEEDLQSLEKNENDEVWKEIFSRRV